MTDGTLNRTKDLSASVVNQIIVFSILILLCSLMYFYVFYRMIAQCQTYIQLLKYLDESSLRAKLSKNA